MFVSNAITTDVKTYRNIVHISFFTLFHKKSSIVLTKQNMVAFQLNFQQLLGIVLVSIQGKINTCAFVVTGGAGN